MSALTSSTSVYASGAFWERLWRMSGINFVVFFVIAYLIYGSQPQVGASADAVVAFYQADRTQILIAAVIDLDRWVRSSPNYLLANNFVGPPASTIGRMKET